MKEFSFVLRDSGQKQLLIVEGFGDRSFYRWVLNWHQAADFAVHSVEEIEVPPSWVDATSDFENNRALVAAVCRAAVLDEVLGEQDIRGVVDRDCGIPSAWLSISSLLVTDYPAIESYCFTPDLLDKWLLLTLRGSEGLTGQELHDQLAPVLAGLFAIRANRGTLGAKVESLLEYKSDRWRLKLEAGPAGVATKQIYDNASVAEDPRQTCYGHDLAAVLMIRLTGKIKNHAGLKTVEGLERSLLSSLERTAMAEQPLINILRAWLTGKSAA
ncbi:MAG: hypothetical protein ACYC1Z_11480 [Georgenia sp.]